jgi:hypothetical protein
MDNDRGKRATPVAVAVELKKAMTDGRTLTLRQTKNHSKPSSSSPTWRSCGSDNLMLAAPKLNVGRQRYAPRRPA